LGAGSLAALAIGAEGGGAALSACGSLALPDSLQFQALWSGVGTQLYFLPGWNVSTLP
jgi:hypothetical protein